MPIDWWALISQNLCTESINSEKILGLVEGKYQNWFENDEEVIKWKEYRTCGRNKATSTSDSNNIEYMGRLSLW